MDSKKEHWHYLSKAGLSRPVTSFLHSQFNSERNRNILFKKTRMIIPTKKCTMFSCLCLNLWRASSEKILIIGLSYTVLLGIPVKGAGGLQANFPKKSWQKKNLRMDNNH